MKGLNLGVWVTRKSLENIESIEEMLKKIARLGISRAYVQVVGRADAHYRSVVLPRAEELESDLDGLQKSIDLARDLSVNISAWMNVNLVWSFGKRPLSPEHVVNAHPDWITYDRNGLSMLDYSSSDLDEVFGPFIDPGVPEVKAFTAAIAKEIAGYDVEEVHLDFVRYPFLDFGYNPLALKYYERWSKKTGVFDSEESFESFRLDSVTEQVRMISQAVREQGKKLSCAVFDDYSERAVRERLQPWMSWLEDGLIDSAVVMAYGKDPEEVIRRVDNLSRLHGSLKGIRIGLGAFNYSSRLDTFMGLIERTLEYEPDEITLFALSSIDKELEEKLSI